LRPAGNEPLFAEKRKKTQEKRRKKKSLRRVQGNWAKRSATRKFQENSKKSKKGEGRRKHSKPPLGSLLDMRCRGGARGDEIKTMEWKLIERCA